MKCNMGCGRQDPVFKCLMKCNVGSGRQEEGPVLGVATVSRIDIIICVFCRISSLL